MGVASILQRTRICTWPVITSARPSCRKRRISSSSTTATAAAIPVFYCYWYYCCYAAIATARLLLLLLLLQLLVWPEYAAAVTAYSWEQFSNLLCDFRTNEILQCRLQTYGGCPTWVPTPYSSEPSPFGWPLSPNDWSALATQLSNARQGFLGSCGKMDASKFARGLGSPPVTKASRTCHIGPKKYLATLAALTGLSSGGHGLPAERICTAEVEIWMTSRC